MSQSPRKEVIAMLDLVRNDICSEFRGKTCLANGQACPCVGQSWLLTEFDRLNSRLSEAEQKRKRLGIIGWLPKGSYNAVIFPGDGAVMPADASPIYCESDGEDEREAP